MRNDRYLVEKVGEHEPLQTSIASDFIKFWMPDVSDVSDVSSDGVTIWVIFGGECPLRMAECRRSLHADMNVECMGKSVCAALGLLE